MTLAFNYYFRCIKNRKKNVLCKGTSKLDILANCIYSAVPHCHKPNNKEEEIQIFYKKVRTECETLSYSEHKFKFEEMAKDFCETKGIHRNELSFSTIESSCISRVKTQWPQEIPYTVDEVIKGFS